MTPEQETARRKKLIKAARATLSMEFGLAFGADRIASALFHLGKVYEEKHPIFRSFIRDIPLEIPFGRSRLLWASAAMLATDDKLAQVEAKYRREILEECVNVIALYSS
ncbi:hypothetical protein ELE36_18665 [Pseudolysobacter antarcticus]|uniref:Uncharacterized protein n=1 Tax=Pseudolysobacter antarcticus TaxID=2511995 RepID=A0A411HP14_9GAMM|nr:hypothetical protein [Pseudolysobacter antarcticus]QBB72225.1 hypothetical protein ELE36_18665 [Pseudolysobacter antarcticus]